MTTLPWSGTYPRRKGRGMAGFVVGDRVSLRLKHREVIFEMTTSKEVKPSKEEEKGSKEEESSSLKPPKKEEKSDEEEVGRV